MDDACGFNTVLVGDNLRLNCQEKASLYSGKTLNSVLSPLCPDNLKNYIVPVFLPTYTPCLPRLLMNLLTSQWPRK